MRRKLPTFVFAVLVALATAGVAAATNGGFTPVQPESPNASHTQTAYYVILGFTSVIFVIVEGALVAFVVKYRSRGRARTVEGAQVYGHTRLELIWTVIPVLILAVIAAVVFVELPKIANAPAAADPIHITVEGHQFYWQFDYPNQARSIGTMYVPVGAVVELKVYSTDVIHSWWIPALGGKIQAIPGHPNSFWFQAENPGTYGGQCAELCGAFHSSMLASVVAEPRAQYDAYIAKTAAATIGKQEWGGVCATCHGNLGQGGYGPAIASNTTITSEKALRSLLRYGVNGTQGAMPPVGDTWDDHQITSLVAYLKQHIYKAAPIGAVSGG
ncbi:MAG TPA: cytochrome c oxidase subunit II [Gaiellaceae bacterium]|nr:cytochrome c oxidase subunit II [Gaiellaceae bacterium]